MPSISKHLIDRGCTFMNQMYSPLVFVVHRTAGHTNVQQLYDYWQATCISSHFGISYDGYGYDPYDIWQFVELHDGAGANCCPNFGNCAPFFNDRGGNANTYTISVEVCTPNTGNNGLMTAKQEDSLVYLIQTVCAQLGIPTGNYSEYWNGYENSHTWIAPNGGVGMHRDVDSRNKGMCPGDPYYHGQMDAIMSKVKGGTGMVWVPPNKDQWIIWRHEAFGKATGTPIPKRDTGIFSIVRKLALEKNIMLGSPLGPEQDYDADWIYQPYEAGDVFWNKNQTEYYVMSGSGEVSY
jgi:hypothetical protein